MTIDYTPVRQDSSGKIRRTRNRLKLALVVIAIGALTFWIFEYFNDSDGDQIPTDYRMPVADPPIEPDRPDLIVRARIKPMMIRLISRSVAGQ